MAILNKEQILQATDIKIETVAVPEWGGEVCVKGLTGAERDSYEASIVQIQGTKHRLTLENLRAKLACYAICDESGKRLFTEREVEALAAKSAQALQRVFEVAQRLSGLTSEDVDSLLKN